MHATLAPHSPLFLLCKGHCTCSRLSNPYNVASRAACIIGVHGNLTPIISTALLATLAPHSPLFLLCKGYCTCSRLSNPYNIANEAACIIIGVHGNLTPIISTALLATLALHSPLFLLCIGHYTCSRLSNPYNVASIACCIIGVHGNLTPIISTALHATLAPHSPLFLLCKGRCTCSRLSNPYNVASIACCIIGVHGNLTPIISTALRATLAPHSLLFLLCKGHCTCLRLSNPYNVASIACCIIGVHGNQTPIISTAVRASSALHSPLTISAIGHKREVPKTNYVGHGAWELVLVGIHASELVLVGIHAQPCDKNIFICIGFCYQLVLGKLLCLAIGLWVNEIDSNCCAFLLPPTAPPPRTKVIGDPVARFARPFESRPGDSVRREVFRQLAAHPKAASMSGWAPPASLLPVTPPHGYLTRTM